MAKEFSWSFSRLKNFETCPKRHLEIDIEKRWKEPEEPGGPLDWGNKVHAAMAASLKGAPLPDNMVAFQKWIDRYRGGNGKMLVEQKYAITRQFAPTAYFAPNVWYRGIGDVVKIDGPVALTGDWKTGAVKHDSVQLLLMAQCIFSHFPEVKKVLTEFIWLAEDCSTPETFDRQMVADEWVGLLGRVSELENAAKTQTYPPKPSGLCKRWCPVQSCPFHGKGSY